MKSFATAPFEPMKLPPLSREPKVSVLVANYNYAGYVGLALDSMLSQTYPRFEVLVCDDGSSDGSCDVIEEYAARDRRIRLIRKANGGQASALNAAYAAADGEIVCVLDSDDVFHPRKIEKVISAFRREPGSGFCTHRVQPVSGTGRHLSGPLPKAMESGWIAPRVLTRAGISSLPPASGLSFRKPVADCIFPLPLAFRSQADGYLMRAAQFLTSIVSLPDVLADYRLHGGNLTGSTVPSLAGVKAAFDHAARHIKSQKDFLASRYGKEVADRLRVEDMYGHWEGFLVMYVLEGKPRNGIHGRSLDELMKELPKTRRTRLWKLILALPPRSAELALKCWWRSAPWKSALSPFLRMLCVPTR